MRRHVDWLLAAALAALTLWALCLALALVGRAFLQADAPPRAFYAWAQRLDDQVRQHAGQLNGWDAATMLQQFRGEELRPYERLLLLDEQGTVVASAPAGWAGQNARSLRIGDRTLWAPTAPHPLGGYDSHPDPYGIRGETCTQPGCRVTDTAWVWVVGEGPRGQLVGIRPTQRTPWINAGVWIYQRGAHLPLGVLTFTAYWVLLALWVFRDARRRGERALAWGLLTLSANLVVLAVYLLTRPGRTCSACTRHLQARWHYCPHCGEGQALPTE